MTFEKKSITKKSENFDKWYTDVVVKAELADYSPVKGCMVIRPYGYGIWENIQKVFDAMIKDKGVENAYFPLFIPYSFLTKEKEHVEGFSPQLAVVTHGGGEKLAEPLVVRPTSETIMYSMYSKWVSSWRDLPVLINQWNNVVRWEKRTFLFLRTTEFLWQEGHTVHENEKEAREMTLCALEWYRKLYEEYFAIPAMVGRKSPAERFAGGVDTYATELLMPDGLALQGATSHYLGQNFAKVFGIQFQDRNGKNEFGHQTSWGLSTRSIGGLIMSHGDDNGLVMPPNLAPIQAVIIPIKPDADTVSYTRSLSEDLGKAGVRMKVDDRDTKTPGWKFNEWELKGVPLRIEIGKREMDEGMLTVSRRDTGNKEKISRDSIAGMAPKILKEIQEALLSKRKEFLRENTYSVTSYGEFKSVIKEKKGVITAFWCEDPECEKKIKDETKATTRVLPLDAKKEKGECVYCSKPSFYRWYFAQAY